MPAMVVICKRSRIPIVIFSAIGIWLVPSLCHADRWGPFSEAWVLSTNGDYEAHLRGGRGTVAEVFQRSTGSCKSLWQVKLLQTPRQTYLSTDGETLVTLDRWGGNDTETPGIIIYRRAGAVRSYSIGELVGDASKLRRSRSSIDWCSPGVSSFDASGLHFLLTTSLGQRLGFDLLDGKRIDATGQTPAPDTRLNHETVSFKTLAAQCGPDKNTEKLVEMLLEDVPIQAWQAHIILHHPGSATSFYMDGTARVGGYVFSFRRAVSGKGSKLSLDFDPFVLEENWKVLASEMEDLKKRYPELRFISPSDYNLILQVETSSRVFQAAGGYRVFGGQVDWYSFNPEDMVKFARKLATMGYCGEDSGTIYIDTRWHGKRPALVTTWHCNKTVLYFLDKGEILAQ